MIGPLLWFPSDLPLGEKVLPDLSAQLDGWLRRASERATTMAGPADLERMSLVTAKRSEPLARVAIIGRLKAGNSQFVNGLLRRSLLQAGFAPRPCEWLRKMGRAALEPRALDPEDLCRAVSGRDKVTDRAQGVRVAAANVSHEELRISLVGTPAIDDFCDDAADVRAIFDQCECRGAAHSGFSAVEPNRAIVPEQAVLRHEVRPALVVLSILDALDARDQAGVLEYVGREAAMLGSRIPVVGSVHSLTAFATDEMWAKVERLVTHSGRRAWRRRRTRENQAAWSGARRAAIGIAARTAVRGSSNRSTRRRTASAARSLARSNR